MNTSEDSSFLFLFLFSGSLLLLPSSSFYSHSSLLPVVQLLARFRGILVSSTPSPTILWSWKWTFGDVFAVQTSYSAFNVATSGEESLKCRGNCYIGFGIFLYIFLRKVGEKGGSSAKQMVASRLGHVLLGKIGFTDYLDNGPNWSSLNGRLVHSFSTPKQSPFHGWGFLGLSPQVKILGEDF